VFHTFLEWELIFDGAFLHIKRTKSKTMGYLPRVLLFNAFELGAESANQIILNNEASSS
jgi:hypothetical protein